MNKDMMYILGHNIKAERVRKDLTQEELAEGINMSLSFISKIEQGLTSPSSIVLYKISRLLNVPMENFFINVEL